MKSGWIGWGQGSQVVGLGLSWPSTCPNPKAAGLLRSGGKAKITVLSSMQFQQNDLINKVAELLINIEKYLEE